MEFIRNPGIASTIQSEYTSPVHLNIFTGQINIVHGVIIQAYIKANHLCFFIRK